VEIKMHKTLLCIFCVFHLGITKDIGFKLTTKNVSNNHHIFGKISLHQKLLSFASWCSGFDDKGSIALVLDETKVSRNPKRIYCG
jgi:hypothetical protein